MGRRYFRAGVYMDAPRAALVFGAAIVLFLAPALLGGQLFSPVSKLYDFAPWVGVKPADYGSSFYGGLLSDPAVDFYTWLGYAREQIHEGAFPAWNPYVLGGTPFFANAQTTLLSPFSLPFWTLPFHYAFGVSAALKLLVAALGAYLLVRELRLGFWPGILAGFAYAFCAFQTVWLSHPQTHVSPWLPWMLWLTERLGREGRGRDAAWLAVVSAFGFLGGHPGTQVHVLLGALLYAALRNWRRLGFVAAGLGLGLLTAAVALLPAALLVPGSAGQEAREGGGGGVPLDHLASLAVPDWWGNPSEPAEVAIASAAGNFNEHTLFAGVAALILAAIALLSRDGWRRKAPIAAVGALGAAVALHVEPVHWVASTAPVLGNVANGRAVLFVQLAVVVLAAFGLEEVAQRAHEVPRRAWLAVAVAAVAGLAALAWALLHDGPSPVAEAAHRDAALRVVVIAGLLAAAFALRRRAGVVAVAAVAALGAVDVVQWAYGYQPSGPAERVVPPRPPLADFLVRSAGVERVSAIASDGAALPDGLMQYRLRDVRGHDPPEPGERYARLLREAGAPASAIKLPRATPGAERLLDLLSVRYVFRNPSEAPLAGPRWSLAYRGRDGLVYRNAGAAPRVRLPRAVERVDGEDEAVARVMSPAFDPRAQSVVEGGRPAAAAGRVRVASEENSKVTLDADLRRGGLVVLADSLGDGWRVEVDGRPADALRTDSVVRGVEVPAGRHRVEWSYRVPGLRPALALTLLGIAGTAALFVVSGRRERGR